MTRLLFFLAAYFAGALGTNHGGYGAGESAGGSGSKDNGQAADGSPGAQALNINTAGGNDAATKLSLNVLEKGQGGGKPIQFIGQPSIPPGKTHQVTVGGPAGLVYTPDSLVAQPGDVVHFHFLSKNHTVTQSSFAKPCVKLADGADSEYLPNGDETLNPPPSYKFQVLDTKPLWFYCKQKGHCGKGMTFSINPTEEKSQAKFRQAAIDQNGAADGSYGADGSSASPSGGSVPSNIPVLAAGTGVAAPSGTAPAASGAIPAPSGNSTVYSAPLQPPPQQNNGVVPPAPAASLPPNVVQGTGATASSQCSCSCFCGVSSFPEGAGVGMFGGIPGSIPA